MEAVEVMMASGLDPLVKKNGKYAQKERQREMNPSRLDKIVDEPII